MPPSRRAQARSPCLPKTGNAWKARCAPSSAGPRDGFNDRSLDGGTAEGGAGADIFVFPTLADDRRDIVTIPNFDMAEDRLDLQDAAIASRHETPSGLLLRLQSGDILRF